MESKPQKIYCPRLAAHRYRFNKDNKIGPLLEYKKLENKEKLFLARHYFRAIGENPSSDPYKLFSEILFNWGVMCPHPKAKREQRVFYYFCGACESCVMNLEDSQDDGSDIAPLTNINQG